MYTFCRMTERHLTFIFNQFQKEVVEDKLNDYWGTDSPQLAALHGNLIAFMLLSLIQTVAATMSLIIGGHCRCLCCKNCCCQYDVTTTDQVSVIIC